MKQEGKNKGILGNFHGFEKFNIKIEFDINFISVSYKTSHSGNFSSQAKASDLN